MAIKIVRVILFIIWFFINMWLGKIMGEVESAATYDKEFYKKEIRKYSWVVFAAYFVLGGIIICSTL